MNLICISGKIARDPEIRVVNGKPLASFTVVVKKKFKPKAEEAKDADFFRCTAWGHDATFIETYGKKGSNVFIHGRIEANTYTNKDGVTVNDWQVQVEDLELPYSSGGGQASYGTSQPRPTAEPAANDYDPFADE